MTTVQHVGSVYPLIPDWDRYVADLLPPALRTEPTWSIVKALLNPLSDLDADQAEIVRRLDPEVAPGAWLDYCGARIGESRGGLSDAEYRRIIVGRTAASWSRGTTAGAWATWLALTGATPDRARIYPVPSVGLPCVYVEGEVAFRPTWTFLQRAAAVIKSAVPYDYDVSAQMYPASAARPGRLPGGGSALGSWTLPTT